MMAPNALRALRERAVDLDVRLAATRHVGRSADDLITAVVTGQGRLIDLSVDDAALSGARAPKLGIGIVEAVQAARSAAQEASVPEMNALFGTRPVAQRKPARGESDHEASFEEVDFLSDEEGHHR